MTDKEIDEMTAGPEGDALVAEAIAWKRDGEQVWNPLPKFSTDIAAAWKVVEKIRERRFYVDISSSENEWLCMINALKDGNMVYVCEGRAPAAPLAICRAVLNAMKPITMISSPIKNGFEWWLR